MSLHATQNSLVAVVVSHNRLDDLKCTIEALLDSPCRAIVVVDNASDPFVVAWLKDIAQNYDHIHPILLAVNKGGAGGFHYGMKFAHAHFSPDWIVVMDDDGRPEAGAIAQFCAAGWAHWDMIGAASFCPKGDIVEMNRPSLNPFWNSRLLLKTISAFCFGRTRAGFHLSDQDYNADQVLPVDALSFVGLFFRTRLLDRINLPKKDYFIYGDDVDFCLRARQSGARIGFAPWLRFEHNCDSTPARISSRALWKSYFTYRNGLKVYRRASGVFFPFVFVICVSKWILEGLRLKGGKKLYFKMLFLSLYDFLFTMRGLDGAGKIAQIQSWSHPPK